MKKYLLIIFLLITAVFAGDAKFSSIGFFELSYTNVPNNNITNKFELNNVYFIYENELSESVAYKFKTDIERTDDDGKLEVYLKSAKLSWKTNLGEFVFGLQEMNVFNLQEKTWGFRSVEKSIMDKIEFSSSADLGIGYYNKLKRVYYNILVTNGSGYKKPENDSYKKISVQVFYGEKNLSLKEGVNFGAVATYEPYTDDHDKNQKYTVVGVFAGFANSTLRVGAEIDQLTNSIEDEPRQILSIYNNVVIHNKVHLYGRVDHLTNANYKNDYLIIGLAYNPEEGLKIMPNIRYKRETGMNDIINYNLNFEFSIN